MTIASERIQKLLDPRFTDLPTGLRARPDSAQDGLAIVGHGAASLAAEARLLATPVTLEQPTSSIAAGIEDRVTMAPVAAMRLLSMSELTLRLAAVELLCAAQAVDLRGTVAALGDRHGRRVSARPSAPARGRSHRRRGRAAGRARRRARGGAGPGAGVAAAAGFAARAGVTADAGAARPCRCRSRQFVAAGDHIREPDVLATLAIAPGPLTPAQCADRACRAASVIDRSRLNRERRRRGAAAVALGQLGGVAEPVVGAA